eukprot:TRINITY_DN94_c0_g2_i1.p2 TRINITY_DN94_c0_g2~~TRINITY_DN94_c0_g2_i1.p2  ORF type:complete len:261 (-),score=58.63 TRINITY_DN94_c0_g2_i1:1599-2381(-)
MIFFFFFFQAEDGIRDAQESRGLGDVYKRQVWSSPSIPRADAEPGLNPRARGWLRHMQAKTSSQDSLSDWSAEGKGPHPWWDKCTTPPLCSWPRFDLQESSYAIALMADATPAWQEAYATVIDGLISRFISHWGAPDFLNQFGDDPQRKGYPQYWRGLIVPHEKFREYNAPGWCGNGLAQYPDGTPAGIQSDPIVAEGMLFFKGWLLMLMGLYTYVSGDKKYQQPWAMASIAGDDPGIWTMDSLAEHLAAQWNDRPTGLH